MQVLDSYLDCLARNDWDGLAATLTDNGLVREGPFCDVVTGKDAYVQFLSGIVPALPNYELRVDRVSRTSDNVAFVELSERFEIDGAMTEHPECILFETGDDGLINRVSVFLKSPGGAPPVAGGSAA